MLIHRHSLVGLAFVLGIQLGCRHDLQLCPANGAAEDCWPATSADAAGQSDATSHIDAGRTSSDSDVDAFAQHDAQHDDGTVSLDDARPDDVPVEAFVDGWSSTDSSTADAGRMDGAELDVSSDVSSTCTLGTFACGGVAGNILMRCGIAGLSPVVTCPSGTCDASLGRCSYCVPGVLACAGVTRLQCDAFGAAQKTVDTCATPELCALSTGTGCSVPLCAEGERICSGTKLLTCNTGRTALSGDDCVVGCAGSVCLSVRSLAANPLSDTICAVLSDGSGRCWNPSLSLPLAVSGLTDATQIAVGATSLGARLSDGSARVWDPVTAGPSSLGPGLKFPVPGLSSIDDLAIGSNFACARGPGGSVRCWGDNVAGCLGVSPTTLASAVPPTLSSLSGIVAVGSMALADQSALVVTSGPARAWGGNDVGQLAVGVFGDRYMPTPSFTSAAQVALGGRHACAVDTAGTVMCAGMNSDGQLGDGTIGGMRATPQKILGFDGQFDQVAAGESHTCGRTKDGAVRCWGRGGSGQLGNGSTANQSIPVAALGVSNVKQIASSGSRTCALLNDSMTLKCWGSGLSTVPVVVPWH